MSEPAIIVEGFGKSYRMRRRPVAHARPGQPARSNRCGQPPVGSRDAEEIVWALRDVGFEVSSGEVVGIIGQQRRRQEHAAEDPRRGSPSRPTGASRSAAASAALLEVGTGFHPELTGRENIYLNGAILGMRRAEIARKFDEIVAFAEVERFLDTPVKRYSSGMYVRLAFAVAAHLEPEILLVDEVLAVGDAAFQRKCLGKMGDVAAPGANGAVRQPQHGRRAEPLPAGDLARTRGG